MGGEKSDIFRYTPPRTDIVHIILIKKKEKTPKSYPRKGNKIGKII